MKVYVKIMCALLACEILDVLPFNEHYLHVKTHVKCLKICVNLSEDLHVKACPKLHVKSM